MLATLFIGGCSYVPDLWGDDSVPQKKPVAHAQLAPAPKPAPRVPVTSAPLPQVAAARTQPPQPPQPVHIAGEKIRVAILLPLSGKSAPMGQAMLNAAQVAVFDMAGNDFELMPRDTGTTPDSAVLAARDAIASGAQLLIGPLFADDVSAIKPVVKSSGVNMLALSTDVSLADSGVWVMGFAPAAQVERVVSYASQRGANRFAAIIPSGAYGALVERAFVDSVQRHGGKLVAVESVARADALREKAGQIDALLLPLGGDDLKQAAIRMAADGIDPARTRFLGTGLWDDAGIGKISPNLVGGWYAASDSADRAAFLSSYSKTYGQEPPRLATLAYDATAMAAVLADRGGRFDMPALTNPNGFAGIDGIFRLSRYGAVERGLAVNEVTNDGGRVIDPSPSAFTDAGR